MIPKYDLKSFANSTAVTTSATAEIYQFVARVGDLGTEKATEYSTIYIWRYRQIQENIDWSRKRLDASIGSSLHNAYAGWPSRV